MPTVLHHQMAALCSQIEALVAVKETREEAFKAASTGIQQSTKTLIQKAKSQEQQLLNELSVQYERDSARLSQGQDQVSIRVEAIVRLLDSADITTSTTTDWTLPTPDELTEQLTRRIEDLDKVVDRVHMENSMVYVHRGEREREVPLVGVIHQCSVSQYRSGSFTTDQLQAVRSTSHIISHDTRITPASTPSTGPHKPHTANKGSTTSRNPIHNIQARPNLSLQSTIRLSDYVISSTAETSSRAESTSPVMIDAVNQENRPPQQENRPPQQENRPPQQENRPPQQENRPRQQERSEEKRQSKAALSQVNTSQVLKADSHNARSRTKHQLSALQLTSSKFGSEPNILKKSEKVKKKSEFPVAPPRHRWKIHRSLSAHNKRIRPALSVYNRQSQASQPIIKPKLIFKLDKIGTNAGELKQPTDCVVLPNGNVIVADYNNKRLQEFDLEGKSVQMFDHPKIKPKAVSLTREKYVAVLDARDRNIKTYTRGADIVCRFGNGYFHDPGALAINSNDHYIIIDSHSIYQKKVFIYDPMTGIQTRLGFHDNIYLFSNPEGVAITHDNHILVTDAGHHCLFVFDEGGIFLRRLGQQGQGPGEFWYPKGVAVDSSNNILIADCGNHRVCLMEQSGAYICDILTKHHALHFPMNIAINSDDILALVQNAEVYVFRLSHSQDITPIHLSHSQDITPINDHRHTVTKGQATYTSTIALSLVRPKNKENILTDNMEAMEDCLLNEGMLI